MSKARIFADDQTRYLRDDIKKIVGKFIVFYVYNPSIATHLCGFSRSYWCIPVGIYTENEIDDDLYYDLANNEPDYFGQSLEQNKKYVECDILPYEEITVEEAASDNDLSVNKYLLNMPDLVEYLQGNQSFFECELLGKNEAN